MTTCDLRDDAVGHAFSALEPDEDRVLEAHLPHCESCRRAHDEALDVVAALGAAVPPVEPPAGLRQRILDAARAEPGTVVRPPAPDPAPEAPSVEVPAPRPRRRLLTAVGGLVAAVVLGVGLIVAQGVLPTQSTPADDPVTALSARADRVVDDAHSRDPAARTTVLRSETGTPAAVLVDPGDATAPVRLVALDLPATGNARDYVVWATGMPGNAPEAVAVMDPDDGMTRPLAAPEGPATPDRPGPRGWAVSIEPTGPVPARPSTVVAIGLVAS
ncbi:anti-sigma-K factor rskA [Actinomycetospora succinea]|uniref:Anti-sigma-K factor rskA n=1 Tax=Actinomycetospora succinea TaxID=663603 RepID=A0A4R6VCX3_9PSEU|nr:anti-sigma factor [Actinomycetospora succinea]TDQ60643.1 anti-sigma-K factor rskA [Actinomycetospora succinea]